MNSGKVMKGLQKSLAQTQGGTSVGVKVSEKEWVCKAIIFFEAKLVLSDSVAWHVCEIVCELVWGNVLYSIFATPL